MLYTCWHPSVLRKRICGLHGHRHPLRKKLFLLTLTLSSVLLPSDGLLCTKVGVAAKQAYDGQIAYVRRGIGVDTAQHIFAEFMRGLATEAWRVDEFATNFSDVCIDNSFLMTKVNDEGSILDMVALEAEIASSHAKIPLLAASRIENVPYDTAAVENSWTQTKSYITALIPPVLDARELIFPDEAVLRVDPSQADACYEFQDRYHIAGYATMPADQYIEGIVSIVMSMISSGANQTKALQILRHATAHVNVGVRCLGVERSDLQMPTIFLSEYAKQTAWLCGSLAAPPTEMARKTAVRNLLVSYHALIDLLTSFQCGGRLSTEVVSAEGRLRHLNFDWTSLNDVQLTISDSVNLDSQLIQYLPTRPQVPRLSIAVRMQDSQGLFQDTQGENRKQASSQTDGQRRETRRMGGIGQSAIYIVHQIQELVRAVKRKEPERVAAETGQVELPTTVRNSCESPWTFVARININIWHEQCCAPICVSAAEGLTGQILDDFQEACCSECNQLSCAGGSEAAAEGAAEVVGITLPPFDEEETPEPIPIMI